MAILLPAGGSEYDVVDMEYANTTKMAEANTGPPALTSAVGGESGGLYSSITFPTDTCVQTSVSGSVTSCKLSMLGVDVTDINTYAKLILTLGEPYDSDTYHVAGWFKFSPDCLSADHGLILLRFGSMKPAIGLRQCVSSQTEYSYQLAVYDGQPKIVKTTMMTNGTYPVLIPNQWHYLRITATGFAATEQEIVFTAWIDGIPVTFATYDGRTPPKMTGYPATIEIGCVRAAAAQHAGDKTVVYIDGLRVSSGTDVPPDMVWVTSATPIITGKDTATLCVSTNVEANIGINYGYESGNLTNLAYLTPDSSRTLHKVDFTVPEGSTVYYTCHAANYNDQTNQVFTTERSFTLTASETAPITIGVISDLQHFTTRAHGGYYLGTKGPDIVLAPGDITSIQDMHHSVWDTLDENARVDAMVANVNILFQPTQNAGCLLALGNHDYVGSSSDPPCSSDWIKEKLSLPGDTYFDFGSVRIITLEDMGPWPTSKVTATQLAFLEDALKTSNQRWNIVQGHYPLYYTYHDGTTNATTKYDDRELLANVLEANLCHIYIGAHRHEFNQYSHGGVLYTINSTTSDYQVGTEFYNAVDEDRYPQAGSWRHSAHVGGYMTLDVYPEYVDLFYWSRYNTQVARYRLRPRPGSLSYARTVRG